MEEILKNPGISEIIQRYGFEPDSSRGTYWMKQKLFRLHQHLDGVFLKRARFELSTFKYEARKLEPGIYLCALTIRPSQLRWEGMIFRQTLSRCDIISLREKTLRVVPHLSPSDAATGAIITPGGAARSYKWVSGEDEWSSGGGDWMSGGSESSYGGSEQGNEWRKWRRK